MQVPETPMPMNTETGRWRLQIRKGDVEVVIDFDANGWSQARRIAHRIMRGMLEEDVRFDQAVWGPAPIVV
jgi:uncharacterized protein YijF (DUF1287 family)